jgi:hypothetical protein
MGNSTSVSETRVNNTTDLNLDQSTRNNINETCNASSIQENVFQAVGSRIRNLTTNQSNIVKNICELRTAVDSTKDASAQSELMTKISEKLKTEGGIPLSGVESKSISVIQNTMQLHLDQSTINNINKDCILAQSQKNIIQFVASDVDGANLNQSNDRFAQCILDHSETSKLGADVKTQLKADKETEATTSGFNPIKDISNAISGILSTIGLGAMSPFIFIAVIICCCVLSSILSSVLMSVGGITPPSPQNSQQFAKYASLLPGKAGNMGRKLSNSLEKLK